MSQHYWKEPSAKLILPFRETLGNFPLTATVVPHKLSINQHCQLLRVFSDSHVLSESAALEPKDTKLNAKNVLLVIVAIVN